MTAGEKWFEKLKQLAEKIAGGEGGGGGGPDDDIGYLMHEIQVYQTELEIQNEELRRSQRELERSRNRFSRLFHEAPAGYVVLDEGGFVLEANRTFANLLRRDRGVLLNKPFDRCIHPGDRKIFRGRFRALHKRPEGKSVEVRMQRGDLSTFHARVEGDFIALETGPEEEAADRFCLVVTDVTEARESEAKLRFILDSLPDMILEVDARMVVRWANKRALELNPDAVGMTCHEAFPGKPHICRGCFCARAFETGRIESGIMHQASSKTAGESYWENIGIPLGSATDGETTVLEVSRNVTARVKSEMERDDLIAELRRALATVKSLSGLLPICSTCKKIRNDEGYWDKLEAYIEQHSSAEFSHSICPDCAKALYPELNLYDD